MKKEERDHLAPLFIHLQHFCYLLKEIRAPQVKDGMVSDKRYNILLRLLIVDISELFTQHSFNIS